MSTDQTPEQIEASIAEQREQLAATVDQLSAKLDVRSRMTTDTGRPRPELIGTVVVVAAVVIAIAWQRRQT